MVKFVQVSPPNSLVLVEDPIGGEVPSSMNQSLIATTPSCIAIGCISEDDGKTSISLGRCNEVDPGSKPVFNGSVATPSRILAIRTVFGDLLLEETVSTSETKLKIWANDASEPDQVVVGIVETE